MRTIIDIPAEMNDSLKELAKKQKSSRAEIIRQALSAYLEKQSAAGDSETGFGLWSHVKEDGVAYQSKLRKEWK